MDPDPHSEYGSTSLVFLYIHSFLFETEHGIKLSFPYWATFFLYVPSTVVFYMIYTPASRRLKFFFYFQEYVLPQTDASADLELGLRQAWDNKLDKSFVP